MSIIMAALGPALTFLGPNSGEPVPVSITFNTNHLPSQINNIFLINEVDISLFTRVIRVLLGS